MRRLLYTIVGLAVFGGMVYAQRGDYSSIKARQVLARMFSPLGNNVYPRFTTANEPDCNANNSGGFYYDTTTDEHKHCDGTSWNVVMTGAGGVGGSGTINAVPKFTAATTIGDSNLDNIGVPATATSGDVFDIVFTLNAIGGGSEIIDVLEIAPDFTNTNGDTTDTVTWIKFEATGAPASGPNTRGIVMNGLSDVSGVNDVRHFLINDPVFFVAWDDDLRMRNNPTGNQQGLSFELLEIEDYALGAITTAWVNIKDVADPAVLDSNDLPRVVQIDWDTTGSTGGGFIAVEATGIIDADIEAIAFRADEDYDVLLQAEGATADGFEFSVIEPQDPTADRTLSWPDDSITWLSPSDNDVMTYDLASRTWSPEAAAGGGGAPTTAQYVTLALDATLTAERTLNAQNGLSTTDNGANMDVDIEYETHDGGDSWFFPYENAHNSATVDTIAPDDNDAALFRVYLDRRLTISNIVLEVTQAVATEDVCVGFYTADGTSLLLESGPIDADTTGIKDTAITPVTIGPGYFLLAFGNTKPDPTNVEVRGVTTTSTIGAIWNTGTTHIGVDTTGHDFACNFNASVTFTSNEDNQVRPYIKFN